MRTTTARPEVSSLQMNGKNFAFAVALDLIVSFLITNNSHYNPFTELLMLSEAKK